MKDESIIISQLVWIAISSNYCSFAKDNLLKYGINDAQAKEMIQLLDKQGEEYLPGMQKAIQAERIIYGFTIFEKAINEGMTKRERDSMSLSGRMPIAPVLKRDYAEYLKVMRSYEKDFNKPYFKLEESIEKKGKRLRKEIPSICVLTKMLTPALSSCRTKLARIIVYTDATKIRLALEIYKNKHGGYPEKLSELTPAILPKLPLSDLTGKPFEYEKNETSYELKTGLEKKEN